jgi:metallo-beta-lactamase class B
LRAGGAIAFALLAVAATAELSQPSEKHFRPDPAKDCHSCAEWNQPQQPFLVYGNTYFVGMAGVSAVLIDGGSELALIDGGLPQSAGPILANVRALGFDPANISTILLSHAHFDHAGGINALQRYTAARVLSSEPGAAALQRGDLLPDDPQFEQPSASRSFPAVENVIAVDDDVVHVVGEVRIRGLHTPGHTPGGMSWTWQACEQGRCLNVVYADSIGPVSAGNYRFSNGLGDAIAASARIIAGLDCDILLGTHPFVFDMLPKYEQGREAFIDPLACRAYGEATLRQLQKRLAAEQSAQAN